MSGLDDLQALRVTVRDGVATVVVDNPPINLFDLTLIVEMGVAGTTLADDPDVRVVVLESANPDFFIAHADVGLIQRLPTDPPPTTELGPFSAMVETFRTMPKPTIVKLEGIARGGGAEFVTSCDMRFATPGAVLGQPEVPLGILPGGSGTQRLPRLVGRSRALEIILGGADVDAATAVAWGWVNRVVPSDEIEAFVDDLARRIASFPPAAVATAKASALRAEQDPVPGLLAETDAFNRLLSDPEAIERMRRFMEDLGGQTPDVERHLTTLYDDLA